MKYMCDTIYTVVRVARTVDYPLEWQVNADKYPQLVESLEDDYGVFIIENDNPSNWWPDREFFRMVHIDEFAA